MQVPGPVVLNFVVFVRSDGRPLVRTVLAGVRNRRTVINLAKVLSCQTTSSTSSLKSGLPAFLPHSWAIYSCLPHKVWVKKKKKLSGLTSGGVEQINHGHLFLTDALTAVTNGSAVLGGRFNQEGDRRSSVAQRWSSIEQSVEDWREISPSSVLFHHLCSEGHQTFYEKDSVRMDARGIFGVVFLFISIDL